VKEKGETGKGERDGGEEREKGEGEEVMIVHLQNPQIDHLQLSVIFVEALM
jgi:hypothetical protein